MSKPFNVRVYGLTLHNHKILVLKEPFMGKIIQKFPGGGLEFGEGTRDCLKREFKEELNLDIIVGKHLYTQDFFMQSGLDLKEQILMIYYRVSIKDISQLRQTDPEIREIIWIDLDTFSKNDLSLPTDRLVTEMLLKEVSFDQNNHFHQNDSYED